LSAEQQRAITEAECADLLAKTALFDGLDEADVDFLASKSIFERVYKGQVLIEEGEEITHLTLMVVGNAKVMIESIWPHFEMTIGRKTPGELIGVSALGGVKRSEITTVMAQQGEVLHIPLSAIVSLCEESAETRATIMAQATKMLANTLRITYHRLMSIARNLKS